MPVVARTPAANATTSTSPAIPSGPISCHKASPRRIGVVGLALALVIPGLASLAASAAPASAATNQVVATVEVRSGPAGIAFNPANGNFYVTNFYGDDDGDGSGTVQVINGSTNQVVTTFEVGMLPVGVAFNSVNRHVYVANSGDHTVSVINGSTNTLVATIPVGREPYGVASANGYVYVTNRKDATLSVINGSTNQVVSTVGVGTAERPGYTFGSMPTAVAFNPTNGYLYVALTGDNGVRVIDPATNGWVTGVGVGRRPSAVAYNRSNGNIYVVNGQDASVSVISGSTHQVTDTVPLGVTAGDEGSLVHKHGIAYNSANGNVYVANRAAHSVSVINGSNNQVIDTVAVGKAPTAVAFDSRDGDAYVANFGLMGEHDHDTVSVILNTSQAVIFTSTAPPHPTVGGTYTATAVGGPSGKPVVFSVDSSSTPGACTVSSAGAVAFTGAGSCVINANQAGDTKYGAARQAQQSLTIVGFQTVRFTSQPPLSPKVGGAYTATASGGASGNPVVFSSDSTSTPDACSVSAAGAVAFTGEGSCVINANQAGNTIYFAAPQAQQTLSIGAGLPIQRITFSSTPPPDPKVLGAYTATATGGASGNPVVFSSDSTSTAGACTVAGTGAVEFTGVGSCVINANQAGNDTYAVAPQVQQTLAITKSSQTITFTSTPPPGAAVGGTYQVTATGGASGNKVIVYPSPLPDSNGVCKLSGVSRVSFIGVGTCGIAASQDGNAAYDDAPVARQSFTVAARDTTPADTTLTATPPNPSTSTEATFSFTGDGTGSAVGGFECKLDAGDFSACTSPKTYSGLGDGSHTVAVRATDAAGNVDPSPASFTWTINTTPPDTSPADTTLTATPSSSSNSTEATFSFTGDGTGSAVGGFECKLDAGDFSACTSPKTYSGLVPGSHTVQVRATDAAGNVDPSPASFTWTIVRKNSADVDGDGRADLCVVNDQAPTGTGRIELHCSSGASNFQAMILEVGAAQAFVNRAQSTTSLADVDGDGRADFCVVHDQAPTGIGRIEVHCASGASNFESAMLDVGAAQPFINRAQSTTSFADVDGDGRADLCVINDQAPTGAGGIELHCSSGASNFQAMNLEVGAAQPFINRAQSTTSLADVDGDGRADLCVVHDQAPTGAGRIEVHCSSGASNYQSMILDVGATEPFINRAQSWTSFADVDGDGRADLCVVHDQAPTGTGRIEVHCSSGASNYQAMMLTVGAVQPFINPAQSWSVIGNRSTRDFSVTSNPLDTSITGTPTNPTSSTEATFTFTGNGTGFECKLADGNFSACTSPKTYSGLGGGSHTVEVRAADGAGNVDPTPATYTWTINPPTTTTSTTVAPTTTTSTTSTTVAPTTTTSTTSTTVAAPAAPAVTVTQAPGQADPTSSAPVNFTAVFSAPVSGFTNADVTVTGTAPGPKSVVVTGSGTTYNLAVSGMTPGVTMTGGGTVAVSIPANVVDGGNQASTSTDDTVTFSVATRPALVRASTGRLLRNETTSGQADAGDFSYGGKPLSPLFGDWDGNGTKTPGTFEAGVFKLRNANSAGAADITFPFGDPRGFPVAGDFNGDRVDDVAVYRNGLWQVRYSTGEVPPTFTFGSGSWPATVPVVGDWDGDGVDGVGVFVAGTWTLRSRASADGVDSTVTFGPGTSPYPVVGDWNGDGVDTVGVKAGTGTTWRLTNSSGPAPPVEITFDFGQPNTDLPMAWR